MQLLLSLLTLGVLPGMWLSGHVLLVLAARGPRLPLTPATAWSLALAVGFPAWSLAMCSSALFGLFHPPTWGAIGWIACLPLAPLVWRRGRLGHQQRLCRRLVLAVLLLGAFALYAAFPHESFFVGRDQATYANQALHIARSGGLALDWPIQISDPQVRMIVGRSNYTATGVYMEAERLVVQFSPILPLWLATAFSALGIAGLQGFNAAVAVLSAAVFFGVAAQLMSRRVALAATALFVFNPMQIWVSRVTLSEILTQYLLLSGMLLGLLATRRGSERLWLLAGISLGASVLVRIDSFVMAPLAVVFGWVMRAVSRDEPPDADRARTRGLLALLFVLALGVPFYLLTSRPYLLSQAKNLLPIAAATAVLSIFWLTRWGTRWLKIVLERRAFWLSLGVALALLGLFAYFVRPRWEPFSPSSNPNASYGPRNFREDSFVNLAVYLTPVTAFAAVAGFWVLLRRGLSGRAKAPVVLFAFLVGGYSLLYLYSPSISPDHPWGMRRFVPIVIPGFVLMASVLLDLARRLRGFRRFHLPFTCLVSVALVAYSNYNTRAGLFLKEYAGAYDFVTSIADAIPSGALLLCDASPRVFGHLALGRGLRGMRLSFRDPERFNAVQSVMAQTVGEDEPYYVLTDNAQKLPGEKPIRTFKTKFSWLAETTAAPAREVRKATFNYYLFERRGPLREPWSYLSDLGFSAIDGAREGGFWPIEGSGGERTRWTRAEAWLDIPLKKGWSPRTLGIEIVGMGPDGTWLTVRANDAELYNARVEKAPLSLSLDLPKGLRKRLKIEIVSDTFRPSEISGSSDARELGVRVKAFTLR